MKTLWILLISLGTSPWAFADFQSEGVTNWMTHLKPSPGVMEQLAQFEGLPQDYVQSLPLVMKERVLRGAESALASGSCEDKINIQFLKSVTGNQASGSVSRFESQFARVEIMSCLSQVTPKQVALTSMSDEYQRHAFDTVVASQVSGPQVCQVTQAPVVGKSSYCYTNFVFESPEGIYIHSYNDFNAPESEAPVYFREIFTAVKQQPQGALFYSLAYVRGADLNSFVKAFAKTSIRNSQQKAMDLLVTMARKRSEK